MELLESLEPLIILSIKVLYQLSPAMKTSCISFSNSLILFNTISRYI